MTNPGTVPEIATETVTGIEIVIETVIGTLGVVHNPRHIVEWAGVSMS